MCISFFVQVLKLYIMCMQTQTASRRNDSHSHSQQMKLPAGSLEGIAKGLSNAMSYGIDCRKTLYQLHGFVPKLPKKQIVKRWTSGIASSCSLVGLIYFSYYAVYNRILLTPYGPLAGQVSALVTSSIKLPIYNGMRMMQSAKATSIGEGCVQLYRSAKPAGVKGIYKGYGVSLVEDMIEMDLRTRLYNRFRRNSIPFNVAVGTAASATAAAVTTPFDNIRLRMCVHDGPSPSRVGSAPLRVCGDLLREQGIRGVYKGMAMRVVSNIVKNCSFFVIFELIKNKNNI